MKKKLMHYITFSILSMLLITSFVYASKPVNKEEYLEITISTGDTLWGLAKKYSDSHHLSTSEFINWVMDVNHLTNQQINAGETIVIPVLKSDAEKLVASK
jgi:hypothetical protein